MYTIKDYGLMEYKNGSWHPIDDKEGKMPKSTKEELLIRAGKAAMNTARSFLWELHKDGYRLHRNGMEVGMEYLIDKLPTYFGLEDHYATAERHDQASDIRKISAERQRVKCLKCNKERIDCHHFMEEEL